MNGACLSRHSTSLRSSFVSSACHSLCSLHSSSPTGRPERVEWKDEGVTRHQAKRDPEEEGRSRQAGGNRGRFLVSGLVSLSTLSPLSPAPRPIATRRAYGVYGSSESKTDIDGELELMIPCFLVTSVPCPSGSYHPRLWLGSFTYRHFTSKDFSFIL